MAECELSIHFAVVCGYCQQTLASVLGPEVVTDLPVVGWTLRWVLRQRWTSVSFSPLQHVRSAVIQKRRLITSGLFLWRNRLAQPFATKKFPWPHVSYKSGQWPHRWNMYVFTCKPSCKRTLLLIHSFKQSRKHVYFNWRRVTELERAHWTFLTQRIE